MASPLERVSDVGQILPHFHGGELLTGTFSQWCQLPLRRTKCLILINSPEVCWFGLVFLPGGEGAFRVGAPRPGQVGFFFERVDFIVELGDPDGVESRHGHGRDGDSYGN